MPLQKRTITGPVSQPLTHEHNLDSFGAQIIDVRFYDAQGDEVAPTGGRYVAEWSANGRSWNVFEGAYFPVDAAAPVEDWQCSGYIDFLRLVPIDIQGADTWAMTYRTHGIGMPSLTARTMSSNRYFSGVNTVQVNGFQQSVLQGNALSGAGMVTLAAGESITINPVKNVDSVFAFVFAEGLFITFNNGSETGQFIGQIECGRLNTLSPFQFQGIYEIYTGGADGLDVVSSKNSLQEVPFITNGGGVIVLSNLSNETVTTYFSAGQVALSAPYDAFLLTPDTLLEPDTEMSNYNGDN